MARHIGGAQGAAKAVLLCACAALAGGAAPDRIDDLLARLTPAEKRGLILGHIGVPAGAAGGAIGSAGYVPGVPRLGIPALQETDGGLGVTNPVEVRRGDGATVFPSGLALAAAWDPALARQVGSAIAREAAARGFNVLLGPGINLVRDPRGGRSFEYFSEDPLLTGTLAAAYVSGVQSGGVVAVPKHFAANDYENARTSYDVTAPLAVLRASDLLAFELTLRAAPGAVMCAYNRVGGAYACGNKTLLTDVLRNDWGFRGWVMSDWGAVHAPEAVSAGLDQESAGELDGFAFAAPLDRALASGRVAPAAIDAAVRHILQGMNVAGLLDTRPRPVEDAAADAALAGRAAAEGIVLLRNEAALLPLDPGVKRIAVIGGDADAGVPEGGGSGTVRPRGGFAREVPLDSEDTPPLDHTARFAGPSPLDRLRAAFPRATIVFANGRYPAEAARRAAHADVAIVCATNWSGEGADLPDLALPAGQDALISAVSAANRRTIVVLETAGPVLMPWRDRVAAILSAWYPGQGGADAIARVIAGTAVPSGHLPVTFPAREADLPSPALPNADTAPSAAHAVAFPEGADTGYRWFAQRHRVPLYPFGFGLSMTHFSLRDVTALEDGMAVSALIVNDGPRPGVAVPQLYRVAADGTAPVLLGFARLTLAAGAQMRIRIAAEPLLLADRGQGRNWNLGVGFDSSGIIVVPR